MAIDYKVRTFDKLIESCLDRVQAMVDKREGSVIWWAVGAACAKLAEFYADISGEMDRAFPDTATDIDLTNKAKERGVFRQHATNSVRRGIFFTDKDVPFDIPINSRFSGGDINYCATVREETGVYLLTAEESGEIGNEYSGNLIPIEYIDGLVAAALTDIVIPGEDEETDESLRKRYFDSLNSEAFGGNIADYMEKIKPMQGVGFVKVFPVWKGGGTVGIVFVDSMGKVPDPVLIDAVQTAVDPEVNQGKGLGTAPIGHVVTVMGAVARPIDISFTLTLGGGMEYSEIEAAVQKAIESYCTELISAWENIPALNITDNCLIVRVSQIESRLLDVEGVLDIRGTTINGGEENIILHANEIPTAGSVTHVN